MATTKKTDKGDRETSQIVIPRLKINSMQCPVLGTEPMLMHNFSIKARRELAAPRKRTQADRDTTDKHDPLEEFRSSVYLLENKKAPTLVGMEAAAFKTAMRDAALRIKGANKQIVGEMVSVPELLVPIYGRIFLHSAMVRNSDMRHTPDVRFRAIVWPWAAMLPLTFIETFLNEQSAINLLAIAGQIQGIGDGRRGKGWGNFGTFDVVPHDDPRLLEVMREGTRAEQMNDYENPKYWDAPTQDLVEWTLTHSKLRKPAAAPPAVAPEKTANGKRTTTAARKREVSRA
jgi:hypothetical protein